MPRGVKGSGAGRKPNAAKAAKTEKRAYKKRTPKTENKTEITVEIKNLMNELLESLTELVKEGAIALKRENAKYGAAPTAAPIAVATTAPEPAAAPAEPKPKGRAKAKADPAPAPAADDPYAGLGLEAEPAAKAPEMTEEESKAKVQDTARAYIAEFGKEKGVPAVRKILKDNFKTELLPNLTHPQRVKTIAILEDAISA